MATELGLINSRDDNGKNLISASSKFLWFSNCHDVRILDVRAIEALKILSGQKKVSEKYSTYKIVWEEQQSKYTSIINEAICELSQNIEWTCILPDCYQEAKEVFKMPWFADRVFDKFLWSIGASKDGAATTFV